MNRQLGGKFRWAATAALLLVTTGFDAAAQASAAPGDVKVNPLEAVPHTDTTLSLFEQHGPTCDWVREDPLAHKRAVVARLTGSCDFIGLVWSPDRQRALVRLGDVVSGQPRIWEVEVATGRSVELPPVPVGAGTLEELGYDAAGTAWLITTQQSRNGVPAVMEYAGRKYPRPTNTEQTPSALGHAFSWDAAKKQWKHVEANWITIGEQTGWKFDMSGLSSSAKLVERASRTVLDYPAMGFFDEADDAAVAEQLWNASGEDPESSPCETSWWRLRIEQVELHSRMCCDDVCGYAGPLMVRTGKGFSRLKLGRRKSDLALATNLTLRGPYLLASERGAKAPVLVDLRTKKAVFDAPGASFAVFWPGPPEKAGPAPKTP